jgi:hypothetical protein
MFTVFHRTRNVSLLRKIADLEEFVTPTGKHWMSGNREEYYEAVAVVNVDDDDEPLEHVWDLTNHQGGQDWTLNNQIIWHAPIEGGHRSSMTGDVIVSAADGHWMIDGGGFTNMKEEGSGRDTHWEMERDMSTYDLMRDALEHDIVTHIHHLLKKDRKHPLKERWLGICEKIGESYFTTKGLQSIADQFGIL